MPEPADMGTISLGQSTPSQEAGFGSAATSPFMTYLPMNATKPGRSATMSTNDGLLTLLQAAERVEAAAALLQLRCSTIPKRSHKIYSEDITLGAETASSTDNFESLGSRFIPINSIRAGLVTRSTGKGLPANVRKPGVSAAPSAPVSRSTKSSGHSGEPTKKKRCGSRGSLEEAKHLESVSKIRAIDSKDVLMSHAPNSRANERHSQSNRSRDHFVQSGAIPAASSSKEYLPANTARDSAKRTLPASSDQQMTDSNIGRYFEQVCQTNIPHNRSLEGVETAKLISKHPQDGQNDAGALVHQYPHGQNRASLLKQVEEAKNLVLRIWEEVGPDACMFVYVLRELCGDEAVKLYQKSAPNSTVNGCGETPPNKCPVNFPKYSAYWDQPLVLAELHDKVMRTVISDKFGRNMAQTRDLILRKTCLHRSCFQRGSYRKKMKTSMAFMLLRMQLAMIYLDYNDKEYCNITFTHRLKASDKARLQRYLQHKREADHSGEVFMEPKCDEKETPCWLLEILSDRYLKQKADENIEETMLWNFALVDYIEELWRRDDVKDVQAIAPIMFIPEITGNGKLPPKHVPQLTPEEASTIAFELKDPATRSDLETRKAKPPIYPGKRFPGWYEPDLVTASNEPDDHSAENGNGKNESLSSPSRDGLHAGQIKQDVSGKRKLAAEDERSQGEPSPQKRRMADVAKISRSSRSRAKPGVSGKDGKASKEK